MRCVKDGWKQVDYRDVRAIGDSSEVVVRESNEQRHMNERVIKAADMAKQTVFSVTLAVVRSYNKQNVVEQIIR